MVLALLAIVSCLKLSGVFLTFVSWLPSVRSLLGIIAVGRKWLPLPWQKFYLVGSIWGIILLSETTPKTPSAF